MDGETLGGSASASPGTSGSGSGSEDYERPEDGTRVVGAERAVHDESSGSEGDDEGMVMDEDGLPVEVELSPECVSVFRRHSDSVYCVAMAPDPSSLLVVSGGGDEIAFVWDRSSGETLYTLSGHSDSVTSAMFGLGCSVCATAGMDGCVCVWRVDPRHTAVAAQLSRKFAAVEPGGLVARCSTAADDAIVEWMCFHPHHPVIVGGDSAGLVWVWKALSGAVIACLSGHAGGVCAGTLSADGRQIISASQDGTVRVWHPNAEPVCAHVFRGHVGSVLCVCSHPEASNPLLLSGGEDGTVRTLHRETGATLRVLKLHEGSSVEAVAFCPPAGAPSGRSLAASAGMDGRVVMWEVDSGTLLAVWNHPEGVARLSWSPAGRSVLTAGVDGTVRVWDTRTGVAVLVLEQPEVQASKVLVAGNSSVLDLAVSGDSRYVLASTAEGTVCVFELALDA